MSRGPNDKTSTIPPVLSMLIILVPLAALTLAVGRDALLTALLEGLAVGLLDLVRQSFNRMAQAQPDDGKEADEDGDKAA